jgi:arylsulfatase A-like enzyme
MGNRTFGLLLSVLVLADVSCQNSRHPKSRSAGGSFDVVIYGGTSAGVAAAVQTARMGKRAVLIEPGRHLGGLTSGGLGATDIGNKAAIGGIAREFYERIALHYARDSAWRQETRAEYFTRRNARQNANRDPVAELRGTAAQWTFEPHVAEQVFRDLLVEAGVTAVFGERLELGRGVLKEGRQIISVRTESGKVFAGKMFIDATYEGDLMAKSGVSYHIGREANSVYGETLNGVQTSNAIYHQFTQRVDPYRTLGDPASGFLPGLHDGSPGEEGSGDRRVQAYNFRLCLTEDPENQRPFARPAGYDPLRYELLRRYIDAGVFDALKLNTPMPNRKTDINNHGAFSSDNIGANYDYPDGNYATRERIFRDHVDYVRGMWWFLQNDPRLPENVRREACRWALCRDEFPDTGGWPHQLYVREARRMISDCVMTEHHCRGTQVAPDPVGLAAYGMDSHNVQRYVRKGAAINEGDVEVPVAGPYPISYRAIVPKASECENLLVPVCLSASHIAYGSIRMEPVFIVLGQSAATAAALAIDDDRPLQRIDYGKLRTRLEADQQLLEWKLAPTSEVTVTNILFLMDDQHRGDWVGAAGAKWMITPNLDRLAREGALFRRAYSSAPSCLPARAALLTGLSPWGHGCLGYTQIPRQFLIEKPRIFTEAGYRTHAIGKQHYSPQTNYHGYQSVELGEPNYSHMDYVPDYERWFASQTGGTNPYAAYRSGNDQRGGIHYPFDEKFHETHWTADRAIAFLENQPRGEKWFLKVSFHRPHAPLSAPKRWCDRYEGIEIPAASAGDWARKLYGQEKTTFEINPDATRGVVPPEDLRETRRSYAAAISFVDEQIGRILEALQKRGELESTLILFTSDHGDVMGDHYLYRKTYPVEGSVNVPMIVRWPAALGLVAKRGQVRHELVELRDVLPTFLDAAGLPRPAAMEGMSLLDALRERTWRGTLDLEHASCYRPKDGWLALMNQRYKYIYYSMTGAQQLFDLQEDPHELRDLAGESGSAAEVSEWRQQMVQHLALRGEDWVRGGDLVLQTNAILKRMNSPNVVRW